MTVTPPQPGSGKSRRCNGHKDTRLLLEAVEAAGGECVPHGRTRPGHWKVYLGGKMIGGISGTPSDHRTRKNDIARLRRNGLNITSKGTYDGPPAQD
ncbi:hypothetical protein CG91_gp087 [Mycobacterium phage 39HC]|uniref:hypothetical protein n=1 Tax=Mycobacterium phage 39HC TaxID=1463809 RepID=UPI0003F20827|nr:hypothetical protein CG91_gp087 [Mycobacterium phage 39HC]AHJ88387.1 hypothetical protein 39HC_087 [Mycobacterium phage 39HC]AHJ88487.1 hypothetical protein 40BC_087 [Mycobacterium phage 40BC]